MEALWPAQPWLQEICLFLQQREEAIYLVGGYVRDWLLGKVSHDLDFAVAGQAIDLAREVADRFRGHFVLLDQDHDTARVVFRRRDGVYDLDFAGLRGGDIYSDLAARDFTINAIAVDIRCAQVEPLPLIDPLHGQADIRDRLIRAASKQAFRDDPLRMLRALRQAASLRFSITPDTEALIRQDVALITNVSAERIRDELAQLLACSGAAKSVQQLDQLGLLSYLLPSVAALRGVGVSSRGDLYEHTLATLDAVDSIWMSLSGGQVEPEIGEAIRKTFAPYGGSLACHLAEVLSNGRDRATLLKFSALLHEVGFEQTRDDRETPMLSSEMAADVLRRLRFSSREVNLARKVIRYHLPPSWQSEQMPWDARTCYRFFCQLGDAGLDTLCLSWATAWAAKWPKRDLARWQQRELIIQELLRYCIETWPEIQALPRLLDGRDLLTELGLRPGPLIGRLLAELREAQAVGEVTTRQEALAWAKRWLGQWGV